MKSDTELQKRLENVIRWGSLLNSAEIGVIVKDGVIALTGLVDNYSKKGGVEDSVKNVPKIETVVKKNKYGFCVK